MTETTAQASEVHRPRMPWIRILHLATLCCFAITQPILVALEGQPVYIRDEHLGWGEIATLLAVLMVILPAIAVGLDWCAAWIGRRLRGYGRDAVFFALFNIILLSLIRPYMGIGRLTREGLAGLTALAVTTPFAVLLTYLYRRFAWLRSWVTFASIGLLVFPAMFLWQVFLILQPEQGGKDVIAKKPVPVVFIVFDEFSATSLMNDNLEIDADHFPNFGRLAASSTWYRKMTTVHPRTGTAVPAILSGRFPVTELPPVAAEFPGNLLQVMTDTNAFDIAVFEPATRLAPLDLRKIPEPERPFSHKVSNLLYTMGAVYPRLILTRDTPVYFPVIPGAWFGIDNNTTTRRSDADTLTEGLFVYNRQLEREKQLNHFLHCLLPSERPRFCFIHAMIPHYPWCYYPDGRRYASDLSFYAQSPSGALGELGEDWPKEPRVVQRYEHRYRLQLGYMDRFVGQVLDRLQEIGSFKDCLLIVTADHGVAFQAGHSRRHPDSENLAEILSVPLFIKLPEQTEGRIDDRNVESVDLFPTVADVLGIDLPEPVDGIPVSADVRRPRKTLYVDNTMTIVEPNFPQLTTAVRRHNRIFSMLSLDKLPEQATSRPSWHGRPVSEFKIREQPAAYSALHPADEGAKEEAKKKRPIVEGLIAGRVSAKQYPESCRDIVLAVDGIIQDSCQPHWEWGQTDYFELMVPRSMARDPSPKFELFWVEESKDGVFLRPMKAAYEP